ncbi:FkbM family methyltransferase [Mesorhizobium sp. M1365]|uniref:FkbM family methyltransferase n=1 Tax=Mesorhizobium sp. M1365 TaxID=2957090 RepID=UPI00333E164A
MRLDKVVGLVALWASRRPTLISVANKVRHQCERIIGLSLSAGIDHERNGEGWLVERLAPTCSYFVDVGGNVGAWSLAMAGRMSNPRGMIFEPSPATAAVLRENLSQYPGLEVVEIAVSDAPGEASFFAEPDTGETSSLIVGHARSDANCVQVQVSTLDQELGKRRIPHVDLLKIDAEGFDYHVLRGAIGYIARGAIDVIQFEYNYPWADAGSTLGGAISLLQRHGYDVSVLLPDGLREFRYDKFREFFHYSNFVAVRRGFLFRG